MKKKSKSLNIDNTTLNLYGINIKPKDWVPENTVIITAPPMPDDCWCQALKGTKDEWAMCHDPKEGWKAPKNKVVILKIESNSNLHTKH